LGLPTSSLGDDWQQSVQRTLTLHRLGRLDEAEPLYRQLLKLRPNDANLNHFYGVLLFQRQRTDEAMARVRRSIKLDPKVASWHNNLGNMLLALQQPAKAAQAYERCLGLDPDNLEVRNNLACLLRQRGHLQQAEALLRDALTRAPAYADAHTNLAVVLAQQGRREESIEAGIRALEHRDDPRSRRVLGILYASCGRRDLAAELIRGWVAQCPEDPQARHHLAAVTGEDVPERASDAYVVQLFDRFAASFDLKLAQLDYRAPALCAQVLRRRAGAPEARRRVLDAGCGTGLCGPLLRPYAAELIGVDLSARMLDHARERGVYDQIEQSELGAWLAGQAASFDLIVSADTLCYFGSLQSVLTAAKCASRPGGWFVFTVEALDEPEPAGYRLRYHGRYAHDRAVLERWLVAAGWQGIELAEVVLRQESGEPVAGWLVSAQA